MTNRTTRIIDANNRGHLAFNALKFNEAIHTFEEAIRLWEGRFMTEDDDAHGSIVPEAADDGEMQIVLTDSDISSIYDNLGVAYYHVGLFFPAIRAFLRALDGRWNEREQSLRFLTNSFIWIGHYRNALHFLRRYEATFGPHRDGWTEAALESFIEKIRIGRSKRLPC